MPEWDGPLLLFHFFGPDPFAPPYLSIELAAQETIYISTHPSINLFYQSIFLVSIFKYIYIYISGTIPISIYLAISISVYLSNYSIYSIYSIYSTYIYLNLSIYICHICLSRSLSICHWKHWQDRLGAIDGNAAKTLLGYMRIHKLNGLCMSKKLL